MSLTFVGILSTQRAFAYSAALDEVLLEWELRCKLSLDPCHHRTERANYAEGGSGSPSGRRPSISWWVRSQIGTAWANNAIPFGVRAIKRLRRSPGSGATFTNPRRS